MENPRVQMLRTRLANEQTSARGYMCTSPGNTRERKDN